MAFNKLNYLSRIIDIQNITLEHQARGATRKWIFNNVIKQNYYISLSTYRKYLGINAKKLIKLVDTKNVSRKDAKTAK
jgi:hypothetical protein